MYRDNDNRKEQADKVERKFDKILETAKDLRVEYGLKPMDASFLASLDALTDQTLISCMYLGVLQVLNCRFEERTESHVVWFC